MIESDSLQIVAAWQEGSPNSSYVGPIVEVAKPLMVRRQANEVAHLLTRIALLCDNSLSVEF